MDWKLKNSPNEVEPTPQELKICEFCGTLNHTSNTECFTCGWKGCFNREEADIDVASRRLRNEFEAVRMEHVTARRLPVLGDFGRTKKTSRWQQMQARWGQWRREIFRRPFSATRRDGHEIKQPTGLQNDSNA